MKLGILKETKVPADARVALTPRQCRMLEEKYPGLEIFVQPSEDRCYTDEEYRNAGIRLAHHLVECDVLVGVKEVNPSALLAGKTYLFFSHTIKRQAHNRLLLQTILEKGIRLVDFETLTDAEGNRIIGFGRWAGLAGTYNGMRALCMRHHMDVPPSPEQTRGLPDLKHWAKNTKLPPVKIAVTGSGRVAGGVEEMLACFGVQRTEIHAFLQDPNPAGAVYVKLDMGDYNSHQESRPFSMADFFSHPAEFRSTFSRFAESADMLIMAAYWDPAAPRLFTPSDMQQDGFRLRIIADITCDIRGSAPSTIRSSDFSNPFYDIDRNTGREMPAISHPQHLTVMAIDNLPCGLPREASEDFGNHLIETALPALLQGDSEGLISRATIAEEGRLTKKFLYLNSWVSGAADPVGRGHSSTS